MFPRLFSSDGMRTLLLVSPAPTHPDNAGNRTRIRALLELYEQLGIDFHFLFFRHEPGDEAAMTERWGKDRCTFLDFVPPKHKHSFPQRLRRKAAKVFGQSLVLPYQIDAWQSDALVQQMRAVADRIQPTAVQVEYVFFSHLFECFPRSVFRILDTHDIVANRHQQFLDHGRDPEWFYTTPAEEARGIQRADCVIAIQPEEKSYFAGLTDRPVATVGHLVELQSPSTPTTSEPTAMFIGSSNRVNHDAFDFLVNEVWPQVISEIPSAVLEVYGRICSHTGNAGNGIRLMGEVPDVDRAYERAWTVLCPLRFGTGLKIKSIEALGKSKALISTTAGSGGLESGKGTAFLCADSASDFAARCVEVLRDSSRRKQLEEAAGRFASEWNDSQRLALQSVLAMAGFPECEPKTSLRLKN